MKFWVILSLLIGSAALGATCPNLSGKYRGDQNNIVFTITQTGCETIQTEYSAKFIADGIVRRNSTSSSFTSNSMSYFTSEKWVLTYFYTDLINGEVLTSSNVSETSLDANKNLIQILSNYDQNGKLINQRKYTATRIN